MLDSFERTLTLADIFFQVMEKPTFVTFIETDITGRNVASILTRWAGGIGRNPEPSLYGPWKAFTLLSGGETKGVSKTPIDGLEDGCQYAGGFRENFLISSCSAWENDKVDLMLALLLQWSFTHEVRLHHVGFRHESKEDRDKAVAADEKRYGVNALKVPAPDHERHYIRVESRRTPNGVYWIEHQLWQDDWTPGMHIDVATSDPDGMINFIAKHAGIVPDHWAKAQDSPCAEVCADETDGTQIAIMARPKWTDVKNWGHGTW